MANCNFHPIETTTKSIKTDEPTEPMTSWTETPLPKGDRLFGCIARARFFFLWGAEYLQLVWLRFHMSNRTARCTRGGPRWPKSHFDIAQSASVCEPGVNQAATRAALALLLLRQHVAAISTRNRNKRRQNSGRATLSRYAKHAGCKWPVMFSHEPDRVLRTDCASRGHALISCDGKLSSSSTDIWRPAPRHLVRKVKCSPDNPETSARCYLFTLGR